MNSKTHQDGRPKFLRSSSRRGAGSASYRKSLSLRSSFFAVADDFRSNERGDWMCSACCYQNPDPCNPICTVCGTKRDEAELKLTASEPLPNSNAELHAAVLHDDKGIKVDLDSAQKQRDVTDFEKDEPLQVTTTSDDMPTTGLSEKQDLPSPKAEGDTTETPRKKRVSFASSFAVYDDKDTEWVCGLCTYVNDDHLHLTCAVCGNQRGHEGATELSQDQSTGSCGEEQSLYLEQERLQAEEMTVRAIESARMEELIAFQSEILEGLQRDRDSIITSCGDANAKSSDGKHALESSHRELEQCEVMLKTMMTLHSDEMMEHQMMEAVQHQRREMIESEEGPIAFEEVQKGGRPPLSKAGTSKRSLVWTAQQRMLYDWKAQLQAQQRELEEIHYLQTELSESFRRYRSS